MSAYTNPSNVFNFIPQAVLQYEINRFLNAEERGNLNAVLEPSERVSRRIPKDNAIKYALCVIIRVQRGHALDLNYWAEMERTPVNLELHGRRLDRYATFLCRPFTAVLFQYHQGAADHAISDLETFLSRDFSFLHTPRRCQALRQAIEHVRGIPFVRHVSVKKV